MRLATFNILHGVAPATGDVDLTLLARELASLDADVIALQEVDRHQPRSAHEDQPARLAELTGVHDHVFAPAMTGLPGEWTPATGAEGPGVPAYGVALLSRFPVTDRREVRLPPAPVRVPYRFPGQRRPHLVRDEGRVAIVADLAGPAGRFRVVTTHLSFLPAWNGMQLRRLVRTLPRDGRPTVLMGDLNLGPSRASRITGMHSLVTAPTFPAPSPTGQIDHLLGRGAVTPAGGSAVWLQVSDHRALVAVVEMG